MEDLIRIGLAINHSYFFYRGVLRGIRRYAETKPNWLFVSMLPQRQALSDLRRHRVAGLIASVDDQETARALSSWRRPLVNVSNVLLGLSIPRVGPDNTHVSQVAAEHLLERGLRNFGFFGPQGQLYSDERSAAFTRFLERAGQCCSCYLLPKQLKFDKHDQRWDMTPGVYRWLKKLKKPAGVFTAGDNWGVQIAEACRDLGLRVPEDVAILGVDDDELDCEFSRPPLSSVILPVQRVGYEAGALLDRLLSGENASAEPILLASLGVATRRSTDVLAIDDAEVTAAVRFIREHAHAPLHVSDVLQQIPVGRRTLEMRFRKTLGRSIGEEIRRNHVDLAKRLLARTTLPMKNVAIKAGFSDVRHMMVVFRQELGQTPGAYRHQASG